MEVIQAFEELFSQVLFMCLLELEGRVVQKTGKIMGKVFEDHVAVVFLDHDFSEINDVGVIKRLQKFDLTDGRNGELAVVSVMSLPSTGCTYAIAFALHTNLLESYHILRIDMDSLEDLSVGAGSNHRFVAGLPVIYRL